MKLVTRGLNDRRKPVNGSKVLVAGVAYKPGIDDMRESPALDILEMLANLGAETSWYDPHVESLQSGVNSTRLQKWSPESFAAFDAVVIVTPHPTVDHSLLLGAGPVIIDTRNALKGHDSPDLIKL